jgi:MscS family membrane protein
MLARSALAVAALLVSVIPARAQQAPDGGAAAATPAKAAPDSPRVAVERFLDLVRWGKDSEAARYLQLDEGQKKRGPILARRLKAVLDQYVHLDPATISGDPEGSLEDGLGRRSEQITTIPNNGSADPVRLVRVLGGPTGHRWVFSDETVAQIDGWYKKLPNRWLRDNLPSWLQRAGPKGLLLWQWVTLILLLPIAWFVGFIISRVTLFVLRRLTQRTAATWDDKLVQASSKPLVMAWSLGVLYLAVEVLDLQASAEAFLLRLLGALLLFAFFWGLLRSVDIIVGLVGETPWAKRNPASRSLLPLGGRIGKVLVVAMAVVAVLSDLGYPVASLVAGLGVGGIALALAAQKTFENLFGAFAVGVDQPFREGDFVKIGDVLGTVENIGLRSTRVRTLDRTLVTIPNGKLAEAQVESYAARDRIRLSCMLGVLYETTAAQMQAILAGCEQVLRAHPLIWPETVVVRFSAFGASSLDIEVMAWFQTTDFDVFRDARQEVFLGFMKVVEEAGSGFAFPTRTIHVVNEQASQKEAS